MRRFFRRLLAFVRSGRAEHDLAREINAHLQLLEEGFAAQGMTAEEARYAARRAFGGVEQVKEHQRDERTFRWLAGWSMDLKLGGRMLIKYPGLTLVGGAAIAFGIAMGAAAFEAFTQVVSPALPLEDGHRIVAIRNWDVANNQEEPRASFDFSRWREELHVVDAIGAFRTLQRNLVVDGSAGEPIEVAEVTVSAFRVARVAPLLGRTLADADELPGAASVLVIGHEVWQSRFGGSPGVLGRTVRVGSVHATVVGVMPAAFAFPVAHRAWMPLRADGLAHGRRQGPQIRVFGRLAPGVSLAEARAALAALGSRAATAFPDTHEHLRPDVLPYAQSFVDVRELALGGAAVNLLIVLFVGLVCANVAALVFARAVTRHHEIVVRTALGAGRGRIVMQLFAESLVLGGVAAAAGLGAAGFVMRWWLSMYRAEAGGRLPFWFDASLSAPTVFYALTLTVAGAAIAGVIPAWKVTGRRLESQLRQASPAGTHLRFGGMWTAVIVSQVAVTVAFPAAAFLARQHVVGFQTLDVGLPSEHYLSARLEIDREAVPAVRTANAELARRLSAEPGVAGVTFASRLPRTLHPHRLVEVAGSPPQRVSLASVGIDYFDVLGAPVLLGREFNAADAARETRAVIVNESFVERLVDSRNPIGRRVRYAASREEGPSPWYEIVGVVRDLGTIHDDPRDLAGMYHPALPDAAPPVHIALRLNGDPEGFATRLRAIAAAVDPEMRLHDVRRLDKVGATLWMEFDFIWRLLAIVSSVALLLSLAGIYSIMSFTVSRRTREIGIRVALGADAKRIVTAIFSRALAQIGGGVVAGGLLVFALTQAATGLSMREVGMVMAYAVAMLAVCMLACIGPTRRALRVEPTEVLREG